MKTKIPVLTLVVLLIFLSGCSYYSKDFDSGFVDSNLGPYKIIKSVQISKTGFRLFFIPIIVPSVREIIAQEVTAAGGDAAINVETTFSEFLLITPFTFPRLDLKFDIIKYSKTAERPTQIPVPAKKEKKERKGIFDK